MSCNGVELLPRWWEKINLPVIIVVCLFGFIYTTTVFGVTIPWLENSVNGVLNVAVLTVTTTLAMIMYLSCVFCEPGKVPEDWTPNIEDTSVTMMEVKRKGGHRYCQKCDCYKPPRAHHCRVCGRCVLRMDHHCVWVNNCVGHRNYKSFFLFLLYVTLSCIHCLGILGAHTVDTVATDGQQKQRMRMKQAASQGEGQVALWAFMEVVCMTLTLPLTIALALLFGWHVYLLVNNKTTIEHYEGVRSKFRELDPTGLPKGIQHPYSLGLWANLREILGANVTCWLAPGCSISGDGLHYANALEYNAWKKAARQKEEDLDL